MGDNILTASEERVLSLIPLNHDNAIHQADLADATGYKTRDIRYIIQSLRSKAIPICSDTTAGYWMAENEMDVMDTIKYMQAQKRTLEASIWAMMEAKEHINEYR